MPSNEVFKSDAVFLENEVTEVLPTFYCQVITDTSCQKILQVHRNPTVNSLMPAYIFIEVAVYHIVLFPITNFRSDIQCLKNRFHQPIPHVLVNTLFKYLGNNVSHREYTVAGNNK